MDPLPAHLEVSLQQPASRCTVTVALLTMLLTFYLGSSVPLLVYSEKLRVARKPVQVIFAPVGWLHRKTPLRYPLEWYAAMWGVHPD